MSPSDRSATTNVDTAAAPGSSAHRRRTEPDWQSHPSVNIADPCPYCGAVALHAQHCKRMCLACGWFRSCAD